MSRVSSHKDLHVQISPIGLLHQMWRRVVNRTNTHIATRGTTTNTITWTFSLLLPYMLLGMNPSSYGFCPNQTNAPTAFYTRSLLQTWCLCAGTLCTPEALVLIPVGTWNFFHAKMRDGTAPKAGGILNPKDLSRLFCFKDLRFRLGFRAHLHLTPFLATSS